ncbi:MAG: UDP-N-acetylmuramoyl-L-alanyl-D-glutamate--2,6-diaminopimelate ligase [Ruminococcaceae bacterium]|nr:UDP-N-acetylmuramoyl-L-alanyl-D-glutamate--2,6-diaminopimelate ligase [Oscillospiraceae bacterium]
MLLEKLLESIDFDALVGVQLDMEISGLCYDSRKAKPGDLFVCVKGYESDGHKYAKSAVEKGAVAIVCEDNVDIDIPKIFVGNSRKAMSYLSACFYGYPSTKLRSIGITGTNGKTSTTTMIKSILEECGYKVGLIGTNNIMIGAREYPSERTTPDSLEFNQLLYKMVEEKVDYLVMEVSSHSLYLDRVAEIQFDVGGITNITQDHLDFHKTMEAYTDAKCMLFGKSDLCILNEDDERFKYMKSKVTSKLLTYGMEKGDVSAHEINVSDSGVSYTVKYGEETVRINLPLPGEFMVKNSLLAIAVALSLKIPFPFIKNALKKQSGIKGRVEKVETGTDYTVIIDYAHTPDGLLNVIESLNKIKKGRLITLFGCGGDRDKTKRPQMAKIATENSDFVIITSDNPRTEDPSLIIKDIVEGVTKDNYTTVENRKEAIAFALDMAKAGDIVLLAGKGHETYQIIGKEKKHFDEREIVLGILSE